MRRLPGLVTAGLAAVLLLALMPPAAAEPPPPGPPARGGPSTGVRYPIHAVKAYITRYPEWQYNPAPSLAQLNKPRVWDFNPRLGIAEDDFVLWTVDDLGNFYPEDQKFVRLTGRKLVNGDYHLVAHVQDAPSITDLFFYIRYDPKTWRPKQLEPGSLFGLKGDRLWFGKKDIPGVICAGMTRIRPDIKKGTQVDNGVVCEVVFQEQPFDYKPHWLDRAPEGRDSAPANATAYMDPDSGCLVLYFEERLAGDYNNDGEVGMTDLIVVGRRYGRVTHDGLEDDWDRLPDGNHDGEVNYRDEWPIEENYGALLSGYRIYRRPAGAPRDKEVLLPHNTRPLLPLSIHRPLEWNPIAVHEYRYTDHTLPLADEPQNFTYRIVPYNAVDDVESETAVTEITVTASRSEIKVVGDRPNHRRTGVQTSGGRP